MNQELSHVSNRLNANKLYLNISKSSFILFHPQQKRSIKSPYKFITTKSLKKLILNT